MNEILRQAMRDGASRPSSGSGRCGTTTSRPLCAPCQRRATPPETASTAPTNSWDAAIRYLPALFRAAGITVLLSVLSMALAVVLGVLLATGRVYGARPLAIVLTAWVELIRGTPLLLQLFVLYFGLAAVVQLPAFLAALLGLGINYAAYESEIYRGALQAIPRGQLEAARTLGFTNMQALRPGAGSPGVPAGVGADDE
jgi:polar amino acid transport system substrate-binding protein